MKNPTLKSILSNESKLLYFCLMKYRITCFKVESKKLSFWPVVDEMVAKGKAAKEVKGVLANDLVALRKEMEDLKAKLKDSEVKGLELSGTLKSVQNELESLKSSKAKLESDLSEKDTVMSQANTQISQFQEGIQQLQQESVSKDDEISRLKAELEKYTADSDAAQRMVDEKESRISRSPRTTRAKNGRS